MAADTARKRLSAMDLMAPWRRVLPLPSGTVDAAARAVLLLLYAGIPGATPVVSARLRGRIIGGGMSDMVLGGV